MPTALGLTGGQTGVNMVERVVNKKKRKSEKARPSVKSKDWVVMKKETQRKQGKEIKSDSTYTGRRRAYGF